MMTTEWLYQEWPRRGATHAFAVYASGLVRIAHCGVRRDLYDDWVLEGKGASKRAAPSRCRACARIEEGRG